MDFQPIPATDGLYEIAQNGTCRHAVTKRILNSYNGKFFFRLNGNKSVNVSVTSVLWQVHGILSTQKNFCREKVRVFIRKDNFFKSFDSIADAARYLAPIVHYTFDSLRTLFSRRRSEISGFSIKYEAPDDLTGVITSAKKVLRIRKKRKGVNYEF